MNCFKPLFKHNKEFEYIFNKSNTGCFEMLSFDKILRSEEKPYYVIEFSDGSTEELDVTTASEAYEIASKKNTVKKISYTASRCRAIA
jgi:hypothetical protein